MSFNFPIRVMSVCAYYLFTQAFLCTGLSVAQDAEADSTTQQADIDSSENQVIDRFIEFGSDVEKKAASAVKREATRDLQLLGSSKTPSPPNISANQNALSEDDDSDAAIEQDIDKLSEQHE